MSDFIRVSAEWALWGKPPGTRDDYGVLAASDGALSRSDFAAIISRFTPGTAELDRRGVGELPWITISWVGVDEGLRLGIAIQEATTQVDGVGRPIAKTSYFAVSYSDLLSGPVTYFDLYQAVKDQELPITGGRPLELAVRRLDPAALASLIGKVGERSVSMVADRLLSGPVSIVQAEGTSLLDRLCFLDAVAAMLPYGYRAKFTASTWSDSGVRHRMRLAFADRKYSNAEAYTWRAGKIASARSDSDGYLTQLDRLRGRSPGGLREFSLREIVEHLAADTEPQRFDQPRYAIDSVRALDLPFAILSAIRAGRSQPADVSQLFTSGRVRELPPDGQRDVFKQLIGNGIAEDWPSVERWWKPIGASSPSEMLPAMIAGSRRQLWVKSPNAAVLDACLQLASRHRLADELLAQLIQHREPTAYPAALSCAAQLVQSWMFDHGKPAQFRVTLDALASCPALACELTAEIALSAHRDRTSRIAVLRQAMPVLLAPFAELAGRGPKPVSEQSIAQLATADRECLGALLRVADQFGQLDHVLPGIIRWLAKAELQPAERRFWRQQLEAVVPQTPDQGASVDVALLAADGEPRHFVRPANLRAYVNRFAEEWQAALQGIDRRRGDPFERAFVRWLDAGTWSSQRLNAVIVINLSIQLTPRGHPNRFATLIASVLFTTDAAEQWPDVMNWLRTAYKPKPAAKESVGSLRRLPANATPPAIAIVSERAFLHNVAPKTAGSALADSAALAQAASVGEVLDAVRSVFWTEYPAVTDRSFLQRITDGMGVFQDPDQAYRRSMHDWVDDMIKAAQAARGRRARKAGPGTPGQQVAELPTGQEPEMASGEPQAGTPGSGSGR